MGIELSGHGHSDTNFQEPAFGWRELVSGVGDREKEDSLTARAIL